MKKISEVFGKGGSQLKYEVELEDGTKTGEFLFLKGIKSREFRRASALYNRRRVELSEVKEFDEQYDRMEEAEIDFLLDIITGWSFDDEFNRDNIATLLQMDGVLDSLAAFMVSGASAFQKKPNSSANGTRRKSSSSKSQKATSEA